MTTAPPRIEVGYQIFAGEGTEAAGAVRHVAGHALTISVEGGGDHQVALSAVTAVHDGKVILDPHKLDAALRAAIQRAHDQEDPNL